MFDMRSTLFYLVATYEDEQFFISCPDDNLENWELSKNVYYFNTYKDALAVIALVKNSENAPKTIQVLSY